MAKFMNTVVIGSGLVAAGLGFAPATVVSAKSAGPVQCELHVSPAGSGVVLRGVARSGEAAAGRYTLTIAKDGDAGSADIEQGGNFAVAPNGASTLSEVSLSLERGASYTAVLTVSWKGGTVTCRQALPAKI